MVASDKIYIKNMVCDRCIAAVRQELQKMDFKIDAVKLGEVALYEAATPEQMTTLGARLRLLGFELIDDKKQQLVQQIRTAIVDFVHHRKSEISSLTFSGYLSQYMDKEYGTLSNLFSEAEGITIEQYMILQKVEKVKELITYGEMNMSEIAEALGYSSVSHLSHQFKKVTGMSPTRFKSQAFTTRMALDKI